MQIGERLKELRKAKGLSLSKMSKKTKCPRVSIIGWENGSRCPSFNNLKKLCKALGASLSVLDKCEPFVKRAMKPRIIITFDEFLSQWTVLCRERTEGSGWHGTH